MPRGRPLGSKNKSKHIEPRAEPIILVNRNLKDLKREIRELRKVKLQCKSGSKERIDLHRKIKDLKKQLKILKEGSFISQENITPLQYIPKEKTQEVEIVKENYPDNNGCSYFGYCKKINKDNIINNTCYNPLYILEKLESKCSQLKREG